jgi:hypothetical protein
MKHRVPHDIGQDAARKATEAAWKSYSERFAKYSPTCSWVTENRADIGFTAKGIKLTGTIEVLSNGIDLDLDVPLLLRPFKGTAIGVIEEEIQKWIGKAKAGQV